MGLINPNAYGLRVRWRDDVMRTFSGNDIGEIVPQPIGSVGVPPDGGAYVRWSKLREPMACFVEDLEIAGGAS